MCAGDFVEVYSHPSQAGESLLSFSLLAPLWDLFCDSIISYVLVEASLFMSGRIVWNNDEMFYHE